MLTKLGATLMTASLLALMSLAPTGCSSGGDDGSDGGFVEPPFTNPLPEQSTFSDDDIRHLLSRTHFGVRESDFNYVQGKGVQAYIDEMTLFPWKPSYETAADAVIVDPLRPSQSELSRWWLQIMQNSYRPFQEHLAMFWHDHFATSQVVLDAQSRRWMKDHVNTLRYHGNGNLRTLLYKMSVDPVMLVWLDGVLSTKTSPNENFAREFWEIFSLGADNGYTQADIVEASKCFTGWRTRYDAVQDLTFMEFDANRHSTVNKTFFGQTITGRTGSQGYLEYQDVVDVTLANRPVAEYIVKRLWEAYVYPNPDTTTIVTPLANLLKNGNWELRPVLKAMFRSQEFYSTQSKTTGFIKDPVQMFIGFSRTTGLWPSLTTLDSSLNNAAHRPTMPPTVFGWPPGDAWLSSQGVVERANYIRECIRYKSGTPSAYVYPVNPILPPAGQQTDANIVDRLITLLRISPSSTERQTYIDYLNTDYNGTSVIADPWNATSQTMIDKKIRGLLYIMAQHPSYFVR